MQWDEMRPRLNSVVRWSALRWAMVPGPAGGQRQFFKNDRSYSGTSDTQPPCRGSYWDPWGPPERSNSVAGPPEVAASFLKSGLKFLPLWAWTDPVASTLVPTLRSKCVGESTQIIPSRVETHPRSSYRTILLTSPYHGRRRSCFCPFCKTSLRKRQRARMAAVRSQWPGRSQ